jgi:hypothetical protein
MGVFDLVVAVDHLAIAIEFQHRIVVAERFAPAVLRVGVAGAS